MKNLNNRDPKFPYCYNMKGEKCQTCKQCGFSGCRNKKGLSIK